MPNVPVSSLDEAYVTMMRLPSPYPCRDVISVFISSSSSPTILKAIGRGVFSHSQVFRFLGSMQPSLVCALWRPLRTSWCASRLG